MQIINDRSITVSTGTGRKCTNWQPAVMTLGELYDRLHTPIRGEETLAAYMQMSKTERDNRKDIGGFVGGQLAGRRKKANVQGRDLVTLDLDNLPPGATAEVAAALCRSGCRILRVFHAQALPGSTAPAYRCADRPHHAAGRV